MIYKISYISNLVHNASSQCAKLTYDKPNCKDKFCSMTKIEP